MPSYRPDVTDAAFDDTPRRVAITVPGEHRAIGVVRLFVGGLAARVDLGYETMDDLQLAVESVLLGAQLGSEITVEAQMEGDAVSVRMGPFERDPLAAGMDETGELALEHLLAALVARAETTTEEGACWLRLDVRIPAGSGA
jgi:hypothetical protein